jgi:hypothetical protein
MGDMSPYPLNVATGARALHPTFRQEKTFYFCNVNGLPKTPPRRNETWQSDC